MKPGKIRTIAICIFHKDGRILCAEGYDEVKQQAFYRPLGGTIEFGEFGEHTVVRELFEEMGEPVEHVNYLGTLENIFVYNGQAGHEIVLVYDGEFYNPEVYTKDVLIGQEKIHGDLPAVWVDLANYSPSKPGECSRRRRRRQDR